MVNKKRQNRERRAKRGDRNKKPQGANRRSKGDPLIFKTDASKYAEVLKAMRGESKLKDLGADVRSIRRSRTGVMILELRKEAKGKGCAYKKAAQEVLGEEVQIRALTPEVTLQLKNLDEITEGCDIAQAFERECGVVVTAEAVRLRRSPAGTQVATIKLPLAWCPSHLLPAFRTLFARNAGM